MGLHCGGHTPSSRDRAATKRGELRHARVRHAGDTPPEGFAWRKTPTATSVERAAGAEGQDGAPVGGGNPATAHTEGATTKQISPNKNHAVPLRYKTLPARPLAPHVRDKTLPARPPSPHFRYKTLPAHPKWLDLALFRHAGRVLYRSHHQEAEQGEFCTEREAEIELANTTGHHAPPVWRAPEGPEGTGGFEATRKVAHQRPGPTGMEDVGEPGGPGRGASG